MKVGRRILGTGAASAVVALVVLLLGAFTLGRTQQPQIPTLQVCNPTTIKGDVKGLIRTRMDGAHAGTFAVGINVTCAAGGYPSGTVRITVDMNDSIAEGTITATDAEIDQVTSTGKSSPTAYISGRCKAQTAQGQHILGCRFWLMLANNKRPGDPSGTADVIGFLVFDGTGKRVAYGTGAVLAGDISVSPTSN